MLLDKKDDQLRDATIRTGQFKEIARDILYKDRELRKRGGNTDTGGAIKRALENAYKLGQLHATTTSQNIDDESEQDTVNWNVIPARSRDAFYSMMQFHCVVLEVPNMSISKTQTEWSMFLVTRGKGSYLKSVSKSIMSHLIKLGLVKEHVIQGKNALVPTALGVDTWNESIDSGLNPDGRHYSSDNVSELVTD